MSGDSINATTSSSNTTRISGLMSTLDVDAMVKTSLALEQSKIDKIKQNIAYSEWRKEAYRGVNTALADFKNAYLSLANNSTTMASSALFNAKTATLSATSAMKVTVNSDVQLDNLKVQSSKVATKAYVQSAEFTPTDGKSVSEMTIKEIADKTGATLTTTVEDGVEVVKFKINGKDFTFPPLTATMGEVVNTINNANIGVKMAYNSFNKSFEFRSTDTGTNAKVDIADSSGLFVGTKGLFGSGDGAGNLSASGTNAQIVVDGKTTESQTNKFTVDGFNFEILADSNQAVDITVGKDVSGVYDRISKFVDAYNKLVTDLSSKISERKSYKYKPLTDSEKEKLSEKEITDLESKAKQGMLYNDNGIRSLLGEVRSIFSQLESSTGIKFSDIGITTGTYQQSPNGQLVINEQKLKDAIEKNGTDVANLFTKKVSFGDDEAKYAGGGLVAKMEILINDYTKNATDVTIAGLSKNISNFESKKTRLLDLLATKEDKLYARYSALETALSKMNGTSSWLFSQ